MTEKAAPGFGEEDIRALAAELEQAERSHVQIRQFSRRFPGMTIAAEKMAATVAQGPREAAA